MLSGIRNKLIMREFVCRVFKIQTNFWVQQQAHKNKKEQKEQTQ